MFFKFIKLHFFEETIFKDFKAFVKVLIFVVVVVLEKYKTEHLPWENFNSNYKNL